MRYKNFLGEIDIICKKNCEVIFIEVKARSSIIDTQYLGHKQKERIKRASLLFLQKNPQYNGYNIRFDLVIVRPFKWPQIFKNAW